MKTKTPDSEQQTALTAEEGRVLASKTLIGHLKDLRRMLVISAGAVAVGFLVIFLGFSQPLVAFLSQPLKDYGIVIISTGLSESFSIQAKASFVAGAVAASPIVLWQIWAFIRPALYQNERVVFRGLFLTAVILFICGVLFAYTLVFNMAIRFFLVSGENIATPMISIDKYISFLFSFLLPFGIMFELPVAIVILSRMGLVTTASLTKFRKYVVIAIFTVAAILTPPDVISQTMLGIPMLALYEIGVLASRIESLTGKKRARR